jgi:hypothetical protein
MCAGEKEKEVTNDGREGFSSLYLFIYFFCRRSAAGAAPGRGL